MQPSQPQQPAPQQPESPQPALQQPVRHHVHHSYIWLGGIQAALTTLVIVLFAGGSSIIGALADGGFARIVGGLPAVALMVGVALLGFLALAGLVFLVQWWSYRHLYYELGDEEFSLYSGIFNKKRVHVPYQHAI